MANTMACSCGPKLDSCKDKEGAHVLHGQDSRCLNACPPEETYGALYIPDQSSLAAEPPSRFSITPAQTDAVPHPTWLDVAMQNLHVVQRLQAACHVDEVLPDQVLRQGTLDLLVSPVTGGPG